MGSILNLSNSRCIRDADGNVPKAVINNPTKHKTVVRNELTDPLPEVLTFNLVWENSPKPSDILKVLLSIPEVLNPNDLFACTKKNKGLYVLKGMICFQAAHYFAFFRRIHIKFDYLDADYRSL
jgi:hypothetical protein